MGTTPVDASTRLLLATRSFTCAGVNVGSFCSSRANAPATWGNAPEVPSKTW